MENSNIIYKSWVIDNLNELRKKTNSPSILILDAIIDLIQGIPEIEVHPIKTNEWKQYPQNRPEKTDYYLCTVFMAEKGGGKSKHQIVLHYDNYSKMWACEDCIVVCWKMLEPTPVDELL